MERTLFFTLHALLDASPAATVASRFALIDAWWVDVEVILDALPGTPTNDQVLDALSQVSTDTKADHLNVWNAANQSGYTATSTTRQIAHDTVQFFAANRTAFEAALLELRTYFAELPVNTVAPVISGLAEVGETLTCTTGTWTGFPTPTYTYQWQRDTGSGFANIGGATASTRVLDGSDETHDVRCVVTATNLAGSATANSNAIANILGP